MYANNSNKSYAHSALSLKIASANLFNFIQPPNAFYHSDQIYTNEQWEKKRAWLNHFITNQQPDIIGFQEVFSISSLKEHMTSLGYSHFCVVDEPEAINHYTFKKPVVCLASRYPIKEITPLKASLEISLKLGLLSDFSYSRTPLRATIELPYLGSTDFYVVHLKSHRPMLDEEARPNLIHEMICAEILGDCRSTTQRASEASYLMISMIQRRFETNNPMVLMGDFNDELKVDALSAFHLTKFRSVTQQQTDLPISHYQLQNSWKLYSNNVNTKLSPPFTHYYQQKGTTLDYILLSNEFDNEDINCLAEVSDFHCEDSHIINDDRDITSSDHAIISATISLRN